MRSRSCSIASAVASILAKSKLPQFLASTALFAVIALFALLMLQSGTNVIIFDALDIYPFSLFFIMLLSTGMLLVNALSYRYSNDYADLSLLLSIAFGGMVIVSSSLSILSIFMGLELISVTTTFMILLGGKNHIEAAVKFFLMSAVSAAVFSFALVLIFPYIAILALSPLLQNVVEGTAIS